RGAREALARLRLRGRRAHRLPARGVAVRPRAPERHLPAKPPVDPRLQCVGASALGAEPHDRRYEALDLASFSMVRLRRLRRVGGALGMRTPTRLARFTRDSAAVAPSRSRWG